MRAIHIVAGLVSLLAGAVALYAAKGSWLHRKSGMLFVVAMLTMTTSAVIIAAFLRPNAVNLMAGSLTLYLVLSSLLTVKPVPRHGTGVHVGLMLVALFATSVALALALSGKSALVDSVPAQPLYLFASIGLLGILGDAQRLWSGPLHGPRRLARHLWRMTFAMWIATASFFLGQAKFFPEPIRKISILAIPVLAVLMMLFYWLWRVRRPRAPVVLEQTAAVSSSASA